MSVWLVNTGWIGGACGVGERIQLVHTRAMITAALSGDLDKSSYTKDPIFGFTIPTTCPGVPSALLNPRASWRDVAAYEAQTYTLAQAFVDNFKQYKNFATQEIQSGGPKLP